MKHFPLIIKIIINYHPENVQCEDRIKNSCVILQFLFPRQKWLSAFDSALKFTLLLCKVALCQWWIKNESHDSVTHWNLVIRYTFHHPPPPHPPPSCCKAAKPTVKKSANRLQPGNVNFCPGYVSVLPLCEFKQTSESVDKSFGVGGGGVL